MDTKPAIYRRYSEIKGSDISWLWYPMIPRNKITLIQGDPGEGKSLMVLNLIASLSRGRALPGCTAADSPINIVYQCSEDGIEDTIKPRLTSADADCSRVAFVIEENDALSMNDERLRSTIADFNATLVVIDPVQSYMGDSDMSKAGGVRRMTMILDRWAREYNCSFILMGHLTKNESSKNLYRGMGSIDFVASARSILQIDHLADNPEVRRLSQIKTNLSRKSEPLFYTIKEKGTVEWLDSSLYESEPIYQDAVSECKKQTKLETTADILRFLLSSGPSPASDVIDFFKVRGIGQRTVETAKKDAGIGSFRKDGQWFWRLQEMAGGYR